MRKSACTYSTSWLVRNTAPMRAVTPSQRAAPRRSPRLAATTAKWIAPLDATSTRVAAKVRAVSNSTPLAGHTSLTARSVKYAANRPAKNISSDASHTTTPTPSTDGPADAWSGGEPGAGGGEGVGCSVTDTAAVVAEPRPAVRDARRPRRQAHVGAHRPTAADCLGAAPDRHTPAGPTGA